MSRERLALTLRLLRREGWRGVAERLVDRHRDARWLASFRDAGTLAAPREPPPRPCPPVLKILPMPPLRRLGGVSLQFLARFEMEARLSGAALLHPLDGAGRHLRLVVATPGERWALRWASEGVAGSETQRLAAALADGAEAAARYLGTDRVHLENLAPLPPAAAVGLARRGLRLILSVHDLFPFCPRPHLLEEPSKRFCDYSRDAARCARCLEHEPAHPAVDVNEWRSRAAELCASSAALVFPSPFLERRLDALLGLPPGRHYVIPPALPAPASLPAPPGAEQCRRRSPRAPLRLAFLGGARPVKGSRLLAELLARLQETSIPRPFRVVVLGGGDPAEMEALARFPEVRIRGYYRSGSLPSVLRREGVDLALLLSPVPESHGLVLDECRWAGVPAVALDHGALGERIRQGGGGVVVPPEAAAPALAELVRSLLADPATMEDLHPVPRPRSDTLESSARRHLDLYAMLSRLVSTSDPAP